MTGHELEEFRQSLKMDRAKFGEFLGYTGTSTSNARSVKRHEKSADPVPLYLARYIWLLQCWIRRCGELPHFPEWNYYNYDHSPDPGHEKAGEDAG